MSRDDLALREDTKSGNRFTRSIPVGYGSATKIRLPLAAQPASKHYNRRYVPFMVYEVAQEGVPNVHPVSLEGSKGQFVAVRWRFRTALAANLTGPGSNFAQSERGKIQQKQRKPWPMVQGGPSFVHLKCKAFEFRVRSGFCGCIRGQKIHCFATAMRTHLPSMRPSKTPIAQGLMTILGLRGVLKFCRSNAGSHRLARIDGRVSSHYRRLATNWFRKTEIVG